MNIKTLVYANIDIKYPSPASPETIHNTIDNGCITFSSLFFCVTSIFLIFAIVIKANTKLRYQNHSNELQYRRTHV